MEFVERSFSGQCMRPKPLVLIEENPFTLLVLTSWGDQDESQIIAEMYRDQMRLDSSTNLTKPIDPIDHINPKINRLREVTIAANEKLFNHINRIEYRSAVEVLAIVIDHNILSWLQVGSPHLLLKTGNFVTPLATQLDLSRQYGQKAPLFADALGIQAVANPNCGSIHLSKNSTLIMVGRDCISPQLYAGGITDLDSISQKLVSDSQVTPFWLAHLSLD